MLKIILIIFLVVGTVLLLASLNPIRAIYKEQRTKNMANAWMFLGLLVLLFIMGYVTFITTLFKHDVVSMDIIVGAILFGGSCFVLAVTRLSILNINEIKIIGSLERHHALHDVLTSLPNRTLLNETMNAVIVATKRKKTTMVVMILDLNNFKEVNDNLGHHYGDKLLQLVAPRLKNSVREIDTVARFGGDEFVVILPEATLHDAKVIVARIIQAIEQPFTIDQHRLNLGISIGISRFPTDGSECDELLKKADIAMYIAKKNSLGFSVYNLGLDHGSASRLSMHGKLRDAIANNELVLHYQPIINLSTGEIHSIEVLTRWFDEELSQVLPVQFIPMAIQTGLIRQLTLWVVETAICELKQLLSNKQDLLLSINFSVKDLQDDDLFKCLEVIFAKYNLLPSQFNFEIAENSLMLESSQPKKLISEINELGVSLSLDDFGTGFSSLGYLKELTTQTIKIDKTFIINMMLGNGDEVIVRSIIDIAHNLDRAVIAEGIESQACLDRLKVLDCEFGQGNYICKPLPSQQIFAWVREREDRCLTT